MKIKNSKEKKLKISKKYNHNNHTFKKIIITIVFIIVALFGGTAIYEKVTINNQYYINEKNLQIPILVYHNIVGNDSEIQYDYMQTNYDNFKKQINGLMNLGYKPISYQDLVDYKNGKKQISKWSFLITFDDGYSGVYNYAYKFAKEKNIPMTSFLINDCVGTNNGYYNWNQAKEMEQSGLISIYSHGYSHLRYNDQQPQKLLDDTNKSYTEISKQLGEKYRLKVFTYPYGLYTDDERKLLWENGYIQNLTDNKINESKRLDLSGLHRSYPLNDSVFKICLKIQYRAFRYK